MKRLMLLTLVLTIGISCLFAEESRNNFYKGMITFKIIRGERELTPQNAGVVTGIEALDYLMEKFEVKSIEKRFRYNPNKLKPGMPDLSRIYRITFPEHYYVELVAQAFDQNPFVEYAEPMAIGHVLEIPNDELFSIQQHLPQIQSEQAWDIHKGEDGSVPVVVGIVDDALLWTHPDLLENVYRNLGEDADGDGQVLVENEGSWVFDPDDVNGIDDDDNGFIDDFIGWDFFNLSGIEDNNPTPDNVGSSHGTHCSGIAAGVTNNQTGISSVGWNVKVMIAKLSNAAGNDGFDWSRTGDGIIYCAENSADIISCSFEGPYSAAMAEAITYARAQGSIIVAAAGNDNIDAFRYPAGYPGVISVASVAVNDEKAYYSNFGIAVDVSIPGGDVTVNGDNGILSTVINSSGNPDYDRYQGTSMASPLAAGVLALIKSYHPDWSNDQLINQLIGTCDDIDDLNPDYINMLGSGRVNAFRALSEINVSVPEELRIALRGHSEDDADGDGALEPGESVSIDLELRNFAHLVSADDLTITMSCDDPDVEIVNSIYSGTMPADTILLLNNSHSIIISESASVAHSARIDLNLSSSSTSITYGQELSFEIMVASSGILIYEGEAGGHNYSGEYFREKLTNIGVDYVYRTRFPSSLSNFEAVFLSWGGLDADLTTGTVITAQQVQIIRDYLMNGGKIYSEGGSILALSWYYEHPDWADLAGLFGVLDFISLYENHPLHDLQGQEGSLAEGISFNSSTQNQNWYLNNYAPIVAGAQVAFNESTLGDCAIQYVGEHNQRTFLFDYSLSNLVDGVGISSKIHLFMKVLDFLEPEWDYLEPQLSANILIGQAPLTVEFQDGSNALDEIISWQWDFNGDGAIDSEEQHPSYDYTEAGLYSVSLTIATEESSKSITVPDYITVFAGETSVRFIEGSCVMVCQPVTSLDLTENFTFELWINPGDGESIMAEDARLIDKGPIKLFIVSEAHDSFNDTSVALELSHSDGTMSRYNTPANSIGMYEWQHIAASYDSDRSQATIYIDGVDQTIEMMPASGEILPNTINSLCVGNQMSFQSGYIGLIDELRIWNVTRTQEDIQFLMHHSISGDLPGLVASLLMNEGEGPVAFDVTEFNNHAAIYGARWLHGVPGLTVSLEDEPNARIDCFQLNQNYPNPFNPSTSINYGLPERAVVSIVIYDILGRVRQEWTFSGQAAGWHTVSWNGTDRHGTLVGGGVYFARLSTGDFSQTMKMVYLR